MTRQRNITPRSFEHTRSFPGTAGNPFDSILQSNDFFERIPALLYFLILAILALLGSKFNWLHSMIYLTFFMSDWLLVSLLPKLKRSFGPVQPVVLILAILRTPFALLPFGWAIAAQCLGTLLVIYGFCLEPVRIRISRENLFTSKFAAGDRIRIVHLGDLHIERITRRERIILEKVNELSPDLILFSGDILNLSYVHDCIAQREAHEFISKLHAPMGVFGVTGSPPVDPPVLYKLLIEGTDLKWLDNQQVKIPVGTSLLQLTGITCSHHPDDDFSDMQELGLSSQNPQSFNILLYHTPDIAPHVCQCGFDLQLSGHTHGGQICLPFFGALFTASLYKKAFEAGRYLVGDMILYVTRGLGMEGGIAPRVRFLCSPELVVWEISAGN